LNFHCWQVSKQPVICLHSQLLIQVSQKRFGAVENRKSTKHYRSNAEQLESDDRLCTTLVMHAISVSRFPFVSQSSPRFERMSGTLRSW